MKPALRFVLALFTILCGTTMASAAVLEAHAGVVFERVCALEGETHFSASLIAPRSPVLRTGMGNDVRPMNIVREIQHGERVSDIVSEGSRLTFLDDIEHAVVSLNDGRRVLVSGGRHGIELSNDVRRVIGHSHPWSLPPSGASAGDLDALRQLGQRSSYLLERGELTRFPR